MNSLTNDHQDFKIGIILSDWCTLPIMIIPNNDKLLYMISMSKFIMAKTHEEFLYIYSIFHTCTRNRYYAHFIHIMC